MSSDTLDLRYWRFFLAIEADLVSTSRYVEVAEANLCTYSIEFARLLLSACSEVDVISKLLCQQINPERRPRKITQYQKVILERFPRFTSMKVLIPRYERTLQPWEAWENRSPSWWQDYQDVKHWRHEHFRKACLGNALHAIAGLFCLELYLYGNGPNARRNDVEPWPLLLTIQIPPPEAIGLEGHYGLPDDRDPVR